MKSNELRSAFSLWDILGRNVLRIDIRMYIPPMYVYPTNENADK